MILYMDTSSLVKLYVEETGSIQVRAWLEEADAVATCRIAYPETLSAMTRRWRNGDLAQSTYDLSRNSGYQLKAGQICRVRPTHLGRSQQDAAGVGA